MKMFNIKAEKNQTYILAIILYLIGFLCDKYGARNIAIEVLSYVSHTFFIIFGSAIAIMWHNENNRLLKSAKIHLSFLTENKTKPKVSMLAHSICHSSR